MRFQTITLAAVAAMALGAAACTPTEEKKADNAGDAIQEEAAQVGSAIAAGAGEVAQEIDEGTDKLAEKADEQKAETANDTQGN